jgi:hypothetical protein
MLTTGTAGARDTGLRTFFEGVRVITMTSESDALLPSNASGSGPSYYFLKNDTSSHDARDMDGGEVVEQLPAGATEDDFASRAVGTPRLVSISVNICKQLQGLC